MPAPVDPGYPTPAEVLGEEIEAVERPLLRSWIVWAGAILGAALVGAFGALTLVTPERRAERATIVLAEPHGSLKDAPQRFRWAEVPGAAVYIVAVTDAGTGTVIVLRPVYETALTPHDSEFSRFDSGSYTWSVEAKARDGSILAHGEAAFTLDRPVG